MKKIVLGCATVLLSLGLLAGCNKEDEIIEPGPEVGGSGTVSYVLGVEVEGTMYYATGETLSNYNYEGELTTNLDEAVEITYSLEGSDEYYVTFEKSGVTYYVAIENVVSSSDGNEHTNLQYTTTKTPLYLHTDSENEYFCNADGSYFLCYNSTYSCLYASSVTSDYGPGNSKASPVAGIYQQDGTLVLGGKGAEADSTGETSNPNINTDPTYTGSDTIPEVGADATTYELAVGTGTIVKNLKRSDGTDFVVGANSGVDEDVLDGQTLTFADVFSIAFVHSESGNSTSSRLWGEGIRVYTGNYFTISTSEGWELSTVSIEYASATASTEYPVITSGENTIATGEATSSSSTYTTVNAGSSEASLSSTTSCTSVTATVTRSDESTNGHLKIKTITVTCATVTDEQP